MDHYLTLECKLESVRDEVVQDLHHTLLIGLYRLVLSILSSLELRVDRIQSHLVAVHVEPHFVHLHHLVYTVLDVKLLDIPSELFGFDLGEVKQVLDKERHHLCRRFVDLQPIVEAL